MLADDRNPNCHDIGRQARRIERSIPSTVKQHMAALEELGGLDVLGSHLTNNMYHGGVGRGPAAHLDKGTKLLALHFGGTTGIRWLSDGRPKSRLTLRHARSFIM